ncbi:MAG TPA: hypothetical protein VKU80_18980 [Planctomycetota bacterium]|nr:hypothetical protein [Planctomycetota bacterium]
MTHLIRPPGEPSLSGAEVHRDFPGSIRTLEEAVRGLLINFWHGPLRERARSIAREMSEACRVSGYKESAVLLRSIQALLSLSAEDTRGIQCSIAERLLELVGLLKEQAAEAES